MRIASLTKKRRAVSIKTRSTPASLSFNGQVTKQATVKWYINVLVEVGVMVLTCFCQGIGPTFFMGVDAEGLEEDFSKLAKSNENNTTEI